jgi:hypothetical protein
LDRTFLAPRVNTYFYILSSYYKKTVIEYTYFHIFYNYIKTAIDIKLAEAKDSGNDISIDFDEK